jgi:hypothetical protein
MILGSKLPTASIAACTTTWSRAAEVSDCSTTIALPVM